MSTESGFPPVPTRAFPLSAKVTRRLVTVVEKARQYLLSRQSPGGGFCAYRGYHLEAPSVADTWLGVEAWQCVSRTALPAQCEHAAFVMGSELVPQATALYQRVRTLVALQARDPRANEVRQAVAALPVGTLKPGVPVQEAGLRHLARTLWLKRYFKLEIGAKAQDIDAALRSMASPYGTYGQPANLYDTQAALSLLTALGTRPDARLAAFVRNVGIPSFGFRLTLTGFSPCLETTCAGLMCCSYLDMHAQHEQDAIQFLAQCQVSDGAFASRPDAKGSLSLTHLALRALDCSGYGLSDLAGQCAQAEAPSI